MPWHVAKSSKCPASKPWACIKNTDGTIEGCHATKEAARKQMAALYANEGKTMTTQDLDDRAASGSTSLDLGGRDESWDAGTAKKALDPGDYSKAFFWRDPKGDPKTLAAYKLPFATPSGGLHAVWKGVTAAAAVIQGGRGGANIPDADVAGVKGKIAAYYRKAAKKYDDDTITVPWASGSTGDGEAELRYAVVPITHIDVRDPQANDDNTWTMSGYAAVFNEKTSLFDGKFIKLTETIDPGFFDRVLHDQPLGQPDGVVHFNFGHDMNRAVAATDVPAGQPGSLQLKADAHGLQFVAKVPRDDPDGVAMAAKMRSGVLRQASFAFTVAKAEYTTIETEDGPDEELRTLLEAKHLYDVCATPQGAYPQTISGLRSYAAALGQPPDGGGRHRQPDLGGGNAVSPDTGGDVEVPPEHEQAVAKLEQSVARGRELLRTRFKQRNQ